MMPGLNLAGLKKAKPWEYAVRFFFGGLVTTCTGLVAHRWGPVVGGLFLGFPAILPASLTLVKRHDGRALAVDDARGATIGSFGLAAFAAVVTATAPLWPPAVVLATATVAWLIVDVLAWVVRYGGNNPGR
jgi:hypothetical protein